MEEVDKTSEAWRLECEARHVLNLAGLRLRRDYLDMVGTKRGEEAKRELKAAIQIEWDKRKGLQCK